MIQHKIIGEKTFPKIWGGDGPPLAMSLKGGKQNYSGFEEPPVIRVQDLRIVSPIEKLLSGVKPMRGSLFISAVY